MAIQLNSLENLLMEQLQELYSAENQWIMALPRLSETVNSPELQQHFQEQLAVTKGHIRVLEEIFAHREESIRGKRCFVLAGIIQEINALLTDPRVKPHVLEAALVHSAQKSASQVLVSYRIAHSYAEKLEQPELARTLERILEDEAINSETLAEIGERQVAEQAALEVERR